MVLSRHNNPIDNEGELTIELSSGFKKYPAKLHALNVARHLGVSQGLVYVAGEHEVPIVESDMTYTFRQGRYFYYLSGVNESGCYITYDISQDDLRLFVPVNTVRKVIWFGGSPTLGEAKERYDVDDVCYDYQLHDYVQSWLNRNPEGKIHAIQSSQGLSFERQPNCESALLAPAIIAARTIKDKDEIAIIRKAVDISSLAHKTVLHHITSLRTEAEVHALFMDVCIAHGAKLQAYTPIIASGQNASVLHYSANNASFKGKNLLCMDAGCEYQCYTSDITRSFPLSAEGWQSEEAERLYALVEAMQEHCINMLAPGVRYFDVYRKAQMIGARGLILLGIFRLPDKPDVIADLVYSGAMNAFFPHGLGHHMGLLVHDVSAEPITSEIEDKKHSVQLGYTAINENLINQWRSNVPDLEQSKLSMSTALLQPGMVITIEPGLYFNQYALDHMWLCQKEFRDLINLDLLQIYIKLGGVRIEDDILITRDGYDNLTKAPKGKKALRIIREGLKCDHGTDCPFR